MRIVVCLFSLSIFSIAAELPYKAMCAAAVIDVIEYPLGTNARTHEQVVHAYKMIPISWGPHEQDREICPRIHQLLLHEVVTVLEETEWESHVQIDSCFTYDYQHTIKSLTGWVLKDNLIDLETLDPKKVPKPITWTAANIDRANVKTICLLTSFSDASGQIYCAGTRFILHKFSNLNYEAYAYDTTTKQFKLISIPQTSCVIDTYFYNPTEKRAHFCNLLSIWTSIPEHCIPLVWGGTSVGLVCPNGNYSLETYTNEDGQDRYGWKRPTRPISDVYSGVDASGFVLRAAQIMGIPYFCRNSTTAARYLAPLRPQEYPVAGDLIWLPGSLLVIKDLIKNTIVTTMSYTSGYGALVELPLKMVFKDINTYQDLRQAYQSGSSLTLLNKDGSQARTVDEFKILKIV